MPNTSQQHPLDRIISQSQQRAIERAAWLACQGKEAEAEATRFGANYHNLSTRADADRAPDM